MRTLFTYVALLLLGGCGEAGQKDPFFDGSANPVTPPRAHVRIVDAFVLAEAQDTPSADDLLRAVSILRETSAFPFPEGEDRVEKWRQQAIELNGGVADEFIPFRGRTKGPAYRQSALDENERHEISEIYYAAEPAILTLKGAEARFRLTVRQTGRDKAVCEMVTAPHELSSCEWLPLYTSPFNIVIENVDNERANYLLISN